MMAGYIERRINLYIKDEKVTKPTPANGHQWSADTAINQKTDNNIIVPQRKQRERDISKGNLWDDVMTRSSSVYVYQS